MVVKKMGSMRTTMRTSSTCSVVKPAIAPANQHLNFFELRRTLYLQCKLMHRMNNPPDFFLHHWVADQL